MNTLTVGELKDFLANIDNSCHVCVADAEDSLFDVLFAEKVDGVFAIALTCPSAWAKD